MYEILDPSLNAPRTGPDPGRIQLPLDIMSAIISHLKSPSDLANIARASRIHHFLSVPLLYHNVILRRPRRRPGGKGMAISALMKPGIAACVKVLEVIDDNPIDGGDQEKLEVEWWQKGQWSDEETVWAVAVAGIVGGCTRLEMFLWKTDDYIHPLLYTALVRSSTLKELKISHPMINPLGVKTNPPSSSLTLANFSNNHTINTMWRPPIIPIPPFRTLRRLCLSNLPSTSASIDDYSSAMFFSPNLESVSLSWRVPTPLGRMLFLQRLLQHQKLNNGRGIGTRSRSGELQTGGKLRLKELELRNVVFDFPMVGDIKEWIDMGRLEKLSFIDCDVVDVGSWLELIGAGTGVLSEGEQATGFLGSGGGFAVNMDSPTASSAGVSTPGTTPGSSLSVLKVVQLKLKSLRINSCASHWVSLLNSFDGLEEFYILDPPVVTADEEVNRQGFLDAIEKHHGRTLKNLRLCSRWEYDRLSTSRLFRACPKLEELAFSMMHSQWKILDVLLVFLTHLRFVHILAVDPLSREDVMEEMMTQAEMMEARLAQEDMLGLQVFAFRDFAHRIDRTISWDDVRKKPVRRGRFVELDEVREWAAIWRAEKVD